MAAGVFSTLVCCCALVYLQHFGGAGSFGFKLAYSAVIYGHSTRVRPWAFRFWSSVCAGDASSAVQISPATRHLKNYSLPSCKGSWKLKNLFIVVATVGGCCIYAPAQGIQQKKPQFGGIIARLYGCTVRGRVGRSG